MRSLQYYAGRLRREKHPARALAAHLLVRTPFCSLFTIHRGAYRIRFHPTALSLACWVDAGSRHGDEDFLARHLHPGDTMVDVGANIGTLTLAAAALVGEAGRVLAMEPHPRTFGYLQRNIAMNSFRNITARNVALGAQTATVAFSSSRLDDQNRVLDVGGIRVPVHTLDELCADLDPIALLKIDTEGYELPVLQGAASVLDRVGVVYFEAWERHYQRYGYATSDILALLSNHGFETFRLTPDRRLDPIPADYRAEECVNLVALRA